MAAIGEAVFQNKDPRTLWNQHRQIIDHEACKASLQCVQLDRRYYEAVIKRPASIKGLAGGGDTTNKSKRSAANYFKLAEHNYCELLRTLLTAEFAHQSLELRRFDLSDVEVRRLSQDPDVNHLGVTFKWPKFAYKIVSIVKGDLIVFGHGGEQQCCYHVGQITSIEGDKIACQLELNESNEQHFKRQSTTNKFTVSPVSAGFPYYAQLRALRYFRFRRPYTSVIAFGCRNADTAISIAQGRAAKIDFDRTNTSELENRLASRFNSSQKTAIRHILEAKCRPRPYILFGPPGTGKTHTLVETVVQIHKRCPQFKILVCVSSNSCADDTAQKLWQTNCFTMNNVTGTSHDDEKKAPTRTMVRCVADQWLKDIPVESQPEYYSSEPALITVTTNIKSGSLRGILFDYIFIDEAAHAHEPETLVPMTKLSNRDGCIVLAGDPKQLEPVVLNHGVKREGNLNRSMLERLYKDYDVYRRRRDPRFITILDVSYRSDKRIMSEWAGQFYKDIELHCEGKDTPLDWMRAFRGVALKSPIVFKGIIGGPGEAVVTMSSSRWHEEEVKVCVDMVMELGKTFKPEQIGVISLYKLQSEMIRRELIMRLWDNADKIRCGGAISCYRTGWREMIDQIVADCHFSRSKRGNKRNKRNTSSSSGLEGDKKNLNLRNLPLKVDTVDAFQGNEREVIIISTVRTTFEKLGFFNDKKRVNVAVSRAKSLLIILGNEEVMKKCQSWAPFLKVASRR